MSFLQTTNQSPIPLSRIPVLTPTEFRFSMISAFDKGERLVLYFGERHGDSVSLYSVFSDDPEKRLSITSTRMVKENDRAPSIASERLAAALFELEIEEDTGIVFEGHPEPNPVRKIFGQGRVRTVSETFDFHIRSIEPVHEVGVGPIHAGIIEPGHFRFACIGEKVLRLDIRLGYQHRGIERLFEMSSNAKKRLPLAESIAGDTVIGHGLAFVGVVEALTRTTIPVRAEYIRGISLELERAAIHTGDLAALSNDIAYLPGNAVFGASRTIIINTLLEICGSRFGRGLLAEGGVRVNIDGELARTIIRNIDNAKKKIRAACEVLFTSSGVLSRFETTGTISKNDAMTLGLVGPAARASDIAIDVRQDHPQGVYVIFPYTTITRSSGDVLARAMIRRDEIMRSFEIVRTLVENLPEGDVFSPRRNAPSAEMMIVSLVEGWRGEIAHCAITDTDGGFRRYKIKDPSFHNWKGLERAITGNGISDFPLCNKSFNLSYCGFDL
jgi:Ni,Fe-hydrogenase III large subunit